jgi:hypothetical protein
MVLIVVIEILNDVTLKEQRFRGFIYPFSGGKRKGEPTLVSPLAEAGLNPVPFSVPPENGSKANLRNIMVYFFFSLRLWTCPKFHSRQ